MGLDKLFAVVVLPGGSPQAWALVQSQIGPCSKWGTADTGQHSDRGWVRRVRGHDETEYIYHRLPVRSPGFGLWVEIC